MSSPIDIEKTKKTIELILGAIKEEADTALLSEYYDLFRKKIPLFQRSKAAAWLLMQYDQGKNFRFSRIERNSSRTAGNDRQFADDDTPRYPLAEEESKRLFFSVGRSRRLFPREILGLINTRTAIPKEDIGAIRILDNYSFVQVRDTVAEKIINALNGINFKGRPLTVNYAKSRGDDENGYSSSSSTKSPGNSGYASEQDQDHSEEEDI